MDRIAQKNVVGWQYYQPDALGSVRQLVNAAGTVIQARSYEPFGKQLSAYGNPLTKYGFTGEWTDPTNLIYLRARYYDPATGRFISKDPVRGLASLPQTLNPYVYGNNNPLRYIDPDGRFPILPLIALAGAFIFFSQIPSDQYQTNPNYWGNPGVQLFGLTLMLTPCISLFNSYTIVSAEPLTRAAKSAYWNQMYSIFLRAYPRFQQFAQTGKMEIHHRIPLQWAHLFPGVDPNRLSNLYALPVNIHRQIVTPAWNAFARADPYPSSADVVKFAIEMDKIIAPYINRFSR